MTEWGPLIVDSLGAVDWGLGVVGVLQVAWWCLWEWWTTVEGRAGRVEASWAVELLALLWFADLEFDMLVEALEGARGRVEEEREPRRSLAWVCWLASPSMLKEALTLECDRCWLMLLYSCKERGRLQPAQLPKKGMYWNVCWVSSKDPAQ